MDALLTGGVVGGLAGGAAVLLFALLLRPPACPACAVRLPRFRRPRSRQQALHGGWTCTRCGTGVDRSGRAIADPAGPR